MLIPELIKDLFELLHNLDDLIQAIGYLGLFIMVFAESGLFFGFFLPGDSLLFTAGFIASQGLLNYWVLTPLLVVGAIAGDSVGYFMGRRFGGWLEKRPDSLLFKKKHLHRAQRFYEKNGARTIVIARFIPAVRTFAPIAAGMARMDYGTFLKFNVVGGFGWAVGMTTLGFFLGSLIPDVDRYLLPIVGAIIVISVIPAILHMREEEEGKEKGFSLWYRVKLAILKLWNRS